MNNGRATALFPAPVSVVSGDARALPLASGTVQAVVTSPPYWGQRDYGFPSQIGVERTPDEYVENMRLVFRELHRVLRDDGVVWLNIGDTYNTRTPIRPSSHNGGLGHANASTARSWVQNKALGLTRSSHHNDRKDKDLLGVPWMLAFALQADGWWLRADVVWSKPWCPPENAPDRPSETHEHLFLLAKSKRYKLDKSLLPRGSVWTVAPAKGDRHSAVFPVGLIEPPILASTSPGDLVCDPFAGSGTAGIVALRHGRRFFGLDGSPTYVDLANERLA